MFGTGGKKNPSNTLLYLPFSRKSRRAGIKKIIELKLSKKSGQNQYCLCEPRTAERSNLRNIKGTDSAFGLATIELDFLDYLLIKKQLVFDL